MAQLNFPQDRTELTPPGTGPLETGDTYTANGTTWVYNADVGAWGSGGGETASDIFLSRVNDDTAAGEITFEKLTTHEGGVSVTGGVFNAASTNQIVSHNGGLAITGGGSEHYLGLFDGGLYSAGKLDRAGTVAGGLISNLTYGSNATGVFTFSDRCNYAAVGDVVKSSFRAFPQGLTFTAADTEKYMAFYANVAANTTSGKNLAWSFYAEGNAPNYFAGSVTCGTGVTVRTEVACQPLQGVGFPGAGNTLIGSRLQSSGVAGFSANHADATSFVTLFNRSNFNGTLISFRKNGEEKGSIEIDDSNITILGQTSDYRVKKNIQPFTSTVDKVKQINVVNFEYTDRAPGVIQEGFVAHELAEICPKAVVGTKDATEAIGTLVDYDGTVLETEVTEPSELEYTEETTDEYGVSTQAIRTRTWTATGTRPVYQGVDQTKLIPLLTKALQEVMQKNEDLEARIAALEGA